MRTYRPDGWSLLKITFKDSSKPECYKIFGDWRGGFADPETWRLSSGTYTSLVDLLEQKDPDASASGVISYPQNSGSVYELDISRHDMHGVHGIAALNSLIDGTRRLKDQLTLFRVVFAKGEDGLVKLPLEVVEEVELL